jgi:hypothetical protein
MKRGDERSICGTKQPHGRIHCGALRTPSKQEDSFMRKPRTERNLLFPSQEFRDRVRVAAKERGFRSEQAFILAACRNELERGDNTEAAAQLEARVAASLVNVTKEVQALFTLVHTQFALTNSLLQYVLTCTAEPPEDALPAARARAKLRYIKILRHAAQEVATRNKTTLEEVITHGSPS